MAKAGTLVEFNRGDGVEYGLLVKDNSGTGKDKVLPLNGRESDLVAASPAEGEIGGGEYRPVE